jgi:hypothetical protein
VSDLERKRDHLKRILAKQIQRALANGKPAFANMLHGMVIRTDAGRYDDELDAMILQHGREA